MDKKHSVFTTLSVRFIDIEELRDKAGQVEVLSLAVKRLVGLGALEDVDIETLMDLHQLLVAEIHNALEKLMKSEVTHA